MDISLRVDTRQKNEPSLEYAKENLITFCRIQLTERTAHTFCV